MFFVNVKTGKAMKIREFRKIISDIVGFMSEIEHDLIKPYGTPRKLLDVSKIRELDWCPKNEFRRRNKKYL